MTETTLLSSHGRGNGANLGFEQQPWAAADKMRGFMDPSGIRCAILGLPLSTAKKPSRGRIQSSYLSPSSLGSQYRECGYSRPGNYFGRCPKCMKYPRYIDCLACGFTMDVR